MFTTIPEKDDVSVRAMLMKRPSAMTKPIELPEERQIINGRTFSQSYEAPLHRAPIVCVHMPFTRRMWMKLRELLSYYGI